jgi:hypothetical protein
MTEYRLYFLDLAGHIVRAQPLRALDDVSASEQATFVAQNTGWELWAGSRLAYLSAPTIPSDLVFVIENATTMLFGLLTSRMHMAWLANIGGRLKSDYRYSIGLVYNAFPWPALSETDHAEVDALAEGVLEARRAHANETLGLLYDPETMPVNLRRAHERLDSRVDRLFRREPFVSDRQRVEHLLAIYERTMVPQLPESEPKRRKRKNLA